MDNRHAYITLQGDDKSKLNGVLDSDEYYGEK